MLFLLLNDANHMVEAWQLCNVTGNMVLKSQPAAQGEKCVRSPSSFDLWTTEKKFGTLDLKTSLETIRKKEGGSFSQIVGSVPQYATLVDRQEDHSSGFHRAAQYVA